MAENFEETLASLQRKIDFILERLTDLERRISKLEGKPLPKDLPHQQTTQPSRTQSQSYLMRTIASVKKKYEGG
ncbi:MAG: hypothetical protein ACK4GQ_04400 [Candidatus Hadarchaeales archaeon]